MRERCQIAARPDELVALEPGDQRTELLQILSTNWLRRSLLDGKANGDSPDELCAC